VAPRHRLSSAASWRRLAARHEDFAPATVQDISRTGLALLVNEPLKGGDILVVRLEEAAGGAAELWLVRVKHARQQPDPEQHWLLGCSFTRPLREDDLDVLLRAHTDGASPGGDEPPAEGDEPRDPGDPFLEGGADERRGAARRVGGVVTVLLCRVGTVEALARGWVHNRSTGGLSLSSPRAFASGSLIKVRLERARAVAPWVQLRVRSCQANRKQWLLGCQFTERLPSHVVMQFG
jgi:hypothetical protein